MTNVIDKLAEYIDEPVIFADQPAPRPAYPYISIKILNDYIPEPGTGVLVSEDTLAGVKQTLQSMPEKVLSITEYSRDLSTAGALAKKARDWFTFVGHPALKAEGYVVVEATAVINRDSLIIDDYERRRGFDVTLRFVDTVSRTVEAIEEVSGALNGSEFDIKE